MRVQYFFQFLLLGILLPQTVSALSFKSQPESVYAKVLNVTKKNTIENSDVSDQQTYSGTNVVKHISKSLIAQKTGNSGVLIEVSELCNSSTTISNIDKISVVAIFQSESPCSLSTQLTNLKNGLEGVTGAIVYSSSGYIADGDVVLPAAVDIVAYYVTSEVAIDLIRLKKMYSDRSGLIGRQLLVALYPSTGSISMILEVTFIGILITVFFAFGLSFCINVLLDRLRISSPTVAPQRTPNPSTQNEKLEKSVLDTFPTRAFAATTSEDDATARENGRSAHVENPQKSQNIENNKASDNSTLLEQRENGKGEKESGSNQESEECKKSESDDTADHAEFHENVASDTPTREVKENQKSEQSLPPVTEQPGAISVTLPDLSVSEKTISISSAPKETSDFVIPIDDESSQVAPKKEVDDSSHVKVHMISNSTCAICLEDFAVGDTLRGLPCEHEYHAACIDPWLTEKSSKCPLCKFDCRPPKKVQEESDSTPDTDQSSSSSSALPSPPSFPPPSPPSPSSRPQQRNTQLLSLWQRVLTFVSHRRLNL